MDDRSRSGDSDCEEAKQSIEHVRVQTANWLRQRSASAAVRLSGKVKSAKIKSNINYNQLFLNKHTTSIPSEIKSSDQNTTKNSDQNITVSVHLSAGIEKDQNNTNKLEKINLNGGPDVDCLQAESRTHPTGVHSNNTDEKNISSVDSNENCFFKKISNKISFDCSSDKENLKSESCLRGTSFVGFEGTNNKNGIINNNNNSKIKYSRSVSVAPGVKVRCRTPLVTSKSHDLNLSLKVSGSTPLRRKSIYQSTESSEGLEVELEQRARMEAEKAMKNKKIFTIIGPYPSLRNSLRRRGWVEKLPSMGLKTDNLESFLNQLSEERNPALVTMMSQVVRNSMPSLVFSVRAVDVGSHATRNSQLVNHFARSSTFTTKAGLCHNLKYVPWFVLCDPNTFYPRCYNLANPEEKDAFQDDFRLTACYGILKHYLATQNNLEVVIGGSGSCQRKNSRISSAYQRHGSKSAAQLLVPTLRVVSGIRSIKMPCIEPDKCEDRPGFLTNQILTPEPYSCNFKDGFDNNPSNPDNDDQLEIITNINENSSVDPVTTDAITAGGQRPKNSSGAIPLEAIKFAIERCQEFIKFKENEDLDSPNNRYNFNINNSFISNKSSFRIHGSSMDWPEFLAQFSTYVKGEKSIEPGCPSMGHACRDILMQMRKYCPQFEMEGCRNIWILKPGAKSRGRGIQCLDDYSEVIRIASSSDSSCVVQKYIERPLLIYKTKFDIRQWFLVADWNPLTLWFYSDCYLRFCSREFSLDTFHVSVHLSNNSVQKHFTPSPDRSKNLPDDNMWTSEEFQEYLKRNGYGRVWSEFIVPEMKQAILCCLLCTQEHIECRKSAFELYGADFMLTEDMKPWLLEINSSPSMAKNTRATSVLVDRVMEDMLKVVLDRRTDKNCDTGRFELIYKQPTVPTPPHPGVNLTIHGRKIRKAVFKK